MVSAPGCSNLKNCLYDKLTNQRLTSIVGTRKSHERITRTSGLFVNRNLEIRHSSIWDT